MKTKKTKIVNKLSPDMSKEQMETFAKQMSEMFMEELLKEIVKKKVSKSGKRKSK